MTVHIGEKHLVKGDKRKTYSDKEVKGFALRTTSQGSFTFYYQHLNKKTGKRDWHLIGAYPEWSIDKARNEARGLAKLAGDDKNIKQIRQRRVEQARAEGVTFQRLHDEYIAHCKQPVERRWGVVPRKETWENIEDGLHRPVEWWSRKAVSEITDSDIMELYESWVDAGHVAQANKVRGSLSTMFKWAMQPPRKYITVSPCANLPPREEERSDIDDGRVLDADEIRTFWFGVDDPSCPGDRRSKLALKLSLVTLLRTGECVKIERAGVGHDTVTIPLKAVKSRRAKKARDVVQPLNPLAREILGELFATDPDRQYAFPGARQRDGEPMEQRTLSGLLTGRTTDKSGQMGILEYLGMAHWTPHALRRTGASILEQLGYDDGLIGKVMTHRATGKEASRVTRIHYLVPKKIIARPVDPRIKALDDLDDALREILGLPPAVELPASPRLLTAA